MGGEEFLLQVQEEGKGDAAAQLGLGDDEVGEGGA